MQEETIFTSYLPVLVMRQAQHNPHLLEQPTGQWMEGVVLSADISGFTTITEHLTRRGLVGIEELSLLLNTYFGQLIDVVIDHGGDIMEFTGDGIIALWMATEEENRSLETCAHQAAQCSLAAQHQLSGQEVVKHIHLSLRIGLGAGEVFVASVGGVLKRWELLIGGDPLVQVSTAQRQAAPGEVMLSPTVWKLIQEHCLGYLAIGEQQETSFLLRDLRRYLLPRPLKPPHLSPETMAKLRGYLPAALLARLDAGQPDWIAELRRVTVLFLNITGIDYASPSTLDHIQGIMHLLQTLLYRYEGSVNQFIVDDKGTLLIAAMGLPPLTHEDDAVRGVKLAMDMQAALRDQGFQSAIGVTTGRILCGSRGSDRRRDYAMIGDVMNLAARLMQAAANTVLCDEATYQAAHLAISFDRLSPINVKGKTSPVAVYSPRSTPQHDMCDYHSIIVGREREQDLLEQQLTALLQTDIGGIAVIEGDAGMGKSQLVSYLLRRAQHHRIASFVGAGDAINSLTPHHAWQPIFRQLFIPTVQQQWEVHDDSMHIHPTDLLHHIYYDEWIMQHISLLNTVVPATKIVTGADISEGEQQNAYTKETHALLLRILMITCAHRPTLIVLDCANWMDTASWELAITASHHIPSLMLVLTMRPLNDMALGVMLADPPNDEDDEDDEDDETSPANNQVDYHALLQQEHVLRLVLMPLSRDETIALLRHCLEVETVDEPVVSLIMQRTQGNPFLSRELAYALRDNGVLAIREGRCLLNATYDTPESLSMIDVPETVQGIIISRIDRLSQRQQLTLKVASVIGERFSFAMLYDLYPIEQDKPHLANDLRLFEQLDLIVPHTPDPNLIYTFSHAITQSVIYNTMLFSQRRELHRAVAEWYQHTYASNLAPYLSRIEYHLQRAQDTTTKALEPLEKKSP